MLCCSTNCEKYETCGRAVGPGKTPSLTSNMWDITVEPLLYWGSGSIGLDKDGHVEIEDNYVCGPKGNWGMYIPVGDFNLSEYQLTCGIKQEEEENKDMDSLEVRVKINSYKREKDSTLVDMDFNNPLYVHSVWGNDNLVELEHDGHRFIVTQSELEKAIRACTHNAW